MRPDVTTRWLAVAIFPIDYCQKPAGKFANARHCNSHKCELVAKRPNHDHVDTAMVISTRTFSNATVTFVTKQMVVNRGLPVAQW